MSTICTKLENDHGTTISITTGADTVAITIRSKTWEQITMELTPDQAASVVKALKAAHHVMGDPDQCPPPQLTVADTSANPTLTEPNYPGDPSLLDALDLLITAENQTPKPSQRWVIANGTNKILRYGTRDEITSAWYTNYQDPPPDPLHFRQATPDEIATNEQAYRATNEGAF